LIHSMLGEREQAIEFFARAEQMFRSTGDREGLATALNGQGEVYSHFNLERALDYHEQALRLSEEAGDLDGQIVARRYLGKLNRALGEAGRTAGREDEAQARFDRAIENYEQSLALCRKLKDRRMEAYNLQDIGGIHESVGDLPKALEYYGDVLRLSLEVKNPRGQSQALVSL